MLGNYTRNKRWDCVPYLIVASRERALEDVIGRKALQKRHFTNGEQAVLFGMGITPVPKMGALTSDSDRGSVPPKAPVHIWEGSGTGTKHCGSKEFVFHPIRQKWIIHYLTPRPAVVRDGS